MIMSDRILVMKSGSITAHYEDLDMYKQEILQEITESPDPFA